MEASESSKVTVEYHDPSGVFPLVSHELARRLPLRNLNWQSPSRPLRQIKSLHVDFVPDKHTSSSLRPPAQRVDSTGPNSVDIVRSGEDPHRQAVNERRHQIPGLKTSPYLKVYLLRCDDKEIYKATERQKLREWIRDNATSDGKRGKHNTNEWLVIHIVIPDTIASSEPRWREGGSKDEDELRERSKGGAKWPGKSTRTVFDKLRADFNESSKTAPDRIAQLRLTKDQVPPDLRPTPAVAPTLDETLPERENAWADLVAKLKNLILIPFDLRVRQYEEDIAEQDSRRALPGWNFCTFFIHKEGLAKALESVGMVEDALALYDELGIGLESVLRDQAVGKADGSATTFPPNTADIEERILGTKVQPSKTSNGKMTSPERGSKQQALAIFSKDYRERIVMSQISVFDFFCYLFIRQKALLLRMANAQIIRQELGGTSNEDLMLISEVTQRTLSFIHSNARVLRADLVHGAQSSTSEQSQSSVDSLVSSWCYAVAGLVLDETTTSAPTIAETNRASALAKLNGNMRRPDSGSGADAYPQRFSSINTRRSSTKAPELRSPPPGQDGMFSPPSSSGGESDRGGKPTLPGMVTLAVHRAELIMLRRKMVESLASRKGWATGWTGQRQSRRNGKPLESSITSRFDALRHEQLSHSLAAILDSEASFLESYLTTSDSAIRHYQLAGHFKSAEAVRGDLAVLKMQQGDYAAAAAYFQQALPAYAADGWGHVEVEALALHAQCLKELRERNDYVRTVLTLLGKVAEGCTTSANPMPRGFKPFEFDTTGYVSDVLEFSDSLPYEITSPLDGLFADLKVNCTVKHSDDRDGFKLSLGFRYVLNNEIELDEVSMRLLRVDDKKEELWLACGGPVAVTKGAVELDLESTTSTSGAYFVDKVIFKAKKLRFEQRIQPDDHPDANALGITFDHADAFTTPPPVRPFVLLYPSSEALRAEIAMSKAIHIDKPRHLYIKLRSGRNDISSLTLRLKPTSAGLRLHLADAKLDNIDQASAQDQQGQIGLSSLPPNAEAVVTIPYTTENPGQAVSLRLEATYHTSAGKASFILSKRLSTELALDVDVNDLFHHDALFSNFTIRPMHSKPVCITDVKLEESSVYAVETPPCLAMPMVVFEERPAKLVFKITQKTGGEATMSKKNAALALTVGYWAIDELVEGAVVGCLEECLKGSRFTALAGLLVPTMREKCSRHLTAADGEVAMLLKEARVPSYDDCGWDEIAATLDSSVREILLTWLRIWHEEYSRITLRDAEESGDALKQITITVDVPNVDYVNTTQLRVLDVAQEKETGSAITILGKPLQVEVSVRTTQSWSATSKVKSKHKQPQAFVLDVQPDPDTWLIGGARRSQFTPSSDGASYTLPLTLISLKGGQLPLPNVDISRVIPEDGIDVKASDVDEPSCETNYESAGQVVTVIRDMRTAEMWFPDSAQGGSGSVRESVERPGSSRGLTER